jgi:glycosyltransferase involved in cell wall biosynthesis
VKVGLVTGEFPPAIGGVGDHTARLARELAAAGHDVEVLTGPQPPVPPRYSVGGPPAEVAAEQAVPVLRLVRRWDVRILAQVPRLARVRGWDVLHIQYQPGAFELRGAISVLPPALRLRRRGGQDGPAVVTTFHDLRVPYLFPKAGPLRPLAVRALATFSDAAIAVDEDDLPALSHWRRHAPPETTRHVPLGNQLDAEPPAAGRDTLWRRFGLRDDRLTIGYLGFVNRSKGVLELVEALGNLVGQRINAQLLMIGEQLGTADPTNRAYHSEVQARIEGAGLAQRVRWTGYLPAAEITACLRAVDVVALPFLDGASQRRTSLIAALAQGTPVVTTAAERHVPWLRTPDGRDGTLLAPPDDAGALSESLRQLLGNPDHRRALGAAARIVAQRFSWPRVVEETVAVYRSALAAVSA